MEHAVLSINLPVAVYVKVQQTANDLFDGNVNACVRAALHLAFQDWQKLDQQDRPAKSSVQAKETHHLSGTVASPSDPQDV